jgi:hypothetical protein
LLAVADLVAFVATSLPALLFAIDEIPAIVFVARDFQTAPTDDRTEAIERAESGRLVVRAADVADVSRRSSRLLRRQ